MKGTIGKIRGWWFKKKCSWLNKRIFIGRGFILDDKFTFSGPGYLIIGDNVHIKKLPGSRSFYSTVFTHSPTAMVSLMDNVSLSAVRISCKHFVLIQDDTTIEDSVLMDTNFHNTTPDRADPVEDPETSKIYIGKGVSIGVRSVICKGVTVPDHHEVTPGTLLTKTKSLRLQKAMK